MIKKLLYVFVSLLFVSCAKDFKQAPSPGRMIKNFRLESGQYGQASIISGDDRYRVIVQVTPDADLSALKPIIEISDDATIHPASGEKIDVSTSKTVTYTVTSASGLRREWTVEFQVYDPSIGDYGTYSISSILNDRVMQVAGDYTYNEKYWEEAGIDIGHPEIAQGQNLQRWQEWDVIYQTTEDDEKYYVLRNLNSGFLLTAGEEEGQQLRQRRKNAAAIAAQLWKIEEVGQSGTYSISNKSNGLYVTVTSAGNKVYVTQETKNDADRQRWNLSHLPKDSYRDDEVCNFFNRTTGSVAFDQGNSILLPDGRVLWVTQDAWHHGSLVANGNLNGNHFISYTNSVIIQPSISDWSPAAPMMTADGRSNGGVGNLIPKQPGKTWSWPDNGVVIDGVVYIHNTEGDGLGSPEDTQSLFKLTPVTATHWKTERTTPPGLTASEKMVRYSSGMIKAQDNYVYVYGSGQKPGSFGHETYLYAARFPQNDPQKWTFWNGTSWAEVGTAAETASINIGLGTNHVGYLNGKYIHLTMDQGFYCGLSVINMYISTSSSPVGPFTDRKLVYSYTEYFKGENARVYTPLLHTDLVNGKDELLATYSINFGACVDTPDGAIKEPDGSYNPYYYRIKGIRIPYAMAGL